MQIDETTAPAGEIPAIDFSECEREPIHALGSVQGHGAMVVVGADGNVVACSRNLVHLTGADAESAFGRRWDDLSEGWNLSIENIPEGPSCATQKATIGGSITEVVAHRNGDLTFWEFVREGELPEIPEGADDEWKAICEGSERANIFRAAQKASETYRALTGYDRIMVYKFHPDLSGEVIAESRLKNALPYLGLRYPATDIPSQARRLFLMNPTRVIADVGAIESDLLVAESHAPIDCSFTRLRGTSPYHIEYLKNMGVAATIANAIIVEGKLWGLIVGHHNSPKICGTTRRRHAERITRDLGSLIEDRERAIADEESRKAASYKTELTERFSSLEPEKIFQWLLMSERSLRSIFDASGVLLLLDEDAYAASGRVPKMAEMKILDQWLSKAEEDVATSESLRDDFGISGSVCGVMASRAKLQDGELRIFLFREEYQTEVLWGGDPATPAVIDQQQRLRPRKSFELWRHRVKGHSRDWDGMEKRSLSALVSAMEASVKPIFSKSLVQDNLDQLYSLRPAQSFLQEFMLAASDDGLALAVESEERQPPTVISVSRAISRILNATPVELESRNIAEILEDAGIPADLCDKEEAFVECWSWKSGQRLLEYRRLSALSLKVGEKTRKLSVLKFKDVTMDRRVMEAMTVARDQARGLLADQEAMLHNLSHELRTPLNAIMGNAELIGMDPRSEDVAGFASRIKGAGEHLKSVVSRILEIASAKSGTRQVVNEEKIDLQRLCEDCIGWLQSQADKRFITLRSVKSALPEGCSLLANESSIRQVVLNLLGNAIKYSPPNSEAGVELSLTTGGHLEMFFWDTGHGIGPDDYEKIFKPFVRLGRTQEDYVEGTGLGLPVSRAIVQVHGGRLEVRSGVETGAHFTVLFPSSRVALDS